MREGEEKGGMETEGKGEEGKGTGRVRKSES